MDEKKTEAEKKIDIRFLYILPSLLALIFAVTAFAYQFGNQIVDLKNTCYTLYLNTPDDRTTDEMIDEVDKLLVDHNIPGFTINLNTQGAFVSDGELQIDDSMQISLMDISRNMVYNIAEELRDTYDVTVMIQEYIVKVTYLRREEQ
ncbi:MAG: hypothetical protein IJT87_04405 [Ruminiclostridium sp.]|nr:hypothetical protein [Ruminiclostridium sp.]